MCGCLFAHGQQQKHFGLTVCLGKCVVTVLVGQSAWLQVAAASSALTETADRADVMAAHLRNVQVRSRLQLLLFFVPPSCMHQCCTLPRQHNPKLGTRADHV